MRFKTFFILSLVMTVVFSMTSCKRGAKVAEVAEVAEVEEAVQPETNSKIETEAELGESAEVKEGESDVTPPETSFKSGPEGIIGGTSVTFEFDSSEENSQFVCRLNEENSFPF